MYIDNSVHRKKKSVSDKKAAAIFFSSTTKYFTMVSFYSTNMIDQLSWAIDSK